MAVYRFPTPVPADYYAYSGNWTIGPRGLTAGSGARIDLAFMATHVYLVLGGTGTIKVSVGRPPRPSTSPACPALPAGVVVGQPSRPAVLDVSPGVDAYDFTFG